MRSGQLKASASDVWLESGANLKADKLIVLAPQRTAAWRTVACWFCGRKDKIVQSRNVVDSGMIRTLCGRIRVSMHKDSENV